MRIVATLAALLGAPAFLTAANSKVQKLTDPHYTITLHGDWVEEHTEDQERRSFSSKSRNTGLYISSVGLPPERADVEQAARKLADLRLSSEQSAAVRYDLKMTIAEPQIIARPWGRSVAYYGSDSSGRQFNYSAAITPKAIVSVYVDSSTLSEKELRAVLDEVLATLEFDKTGSY